jgi:DNA-binding LacI/PurR family transcriptional regulator
MVSISDVATRAGVSVTTVSHTLSGKRKVSENVRERVQLAMTELGYVPRRSAQSLVSGRTRIIGLIVPDISNEFFAELTRGAEMAAVDRGYNVIICTTGFDHAREVHYLTMIRSRAVDGLVYAAGSPPSTSELGDILGDLPLVLVDEEVPGSDAPSFVSDNYEGGRLVAEHLLGLGHRRAAVLAADGALVSSDLRVRGFREAWIAAVGEAPEVFVGAFTAEGGRAAISPHVGRLVERDVTAVFAVNDLMALGAIDELESAGVAIPHDISIVGFDDITAGRYARPRLTTVHQHVAELGARAVSALVTQLDAPTGETHALSHERSVLPVTLTIRESTAPARRGKE